MTLTSILVRGKKKKKSKRKNNYNYYDSDDSFINDDSDDIEDHPGEIGPIVSDGMEDSGGPVESIAVWASARAAEGPYRNRFGVRSRQMEASRIRA